MMSREERAELFVNQESADAFGPYLDELAEFANDPHSAIRINERKQGND